MEIVPAHILYFVVVSSKRGLSFAPHIFIFKLEMKTGRLSKICNENHQMVLSQILLQCLNDSIVNYILEKPTVGWVTVLFEILCITPLRFSYQLKPKFGQESLL